MGGAASVHLKSNELAELAEQEEYDNVAAIVRDRKIKARTAMALTDKAIEELADDELTRISIRAARDEFKEAVSKDDFLTPSRVDDVKREEKFAAAAPPPLAPVPAASLPTVDPDVVLRFVAASGGAEPWSCEGAATLLRWWNGRVLPALGDFNKTDQRPFLLEIAAALVDGPTIVAACCEETAKAPFVRVHFGADGGKLPGSYGLKAKLNNLLLEDGLGYYQVMYQACAAQGMTPMGDYVFDKVLGAGGFGSVFLTRHKHTKKPYALKIVRVDTSRPGAMQKASREIALQQKAAEASPYIANVHNWGQAGERFLFFALEYCSGGDLVQYVIRGKGIEDIWQRWSR